MAFVLKINPAYADQRITTATGVKKVSEHTPEELVKLAIMALQSRDKTLLQCFIDLPATPHELIEDKVEFEQKEIVANTTTSDEDAEELTNDEALLKTL